GRNAPGCGVFLDETGWPILPGCPGQPDKEPAKAGPGTTFLQHFLEQLAHFGWVASGTNTASFHHFQLGVGRVGTTGDQGTGVTHAFSGRRCHTSDKANNGLGHIVFSPQSRVDFVWTADLANHDNGIGIRIVVEHLEHVDVLQTVDWVATDTDSRGLTQAQFGYLSNGFVCQRAGAADHTDAALAVNVAGHDTDLQLVRSDQTGAVRAQQQGFAVFCAHAVAHFQHVANRDAFGNADNQVQVSFNSFPDGSRSTCGRNVDNRHSCASFSLGVGHGGVNRYTFEILTSTLGVHASHKGFHAVTVFTAHAGVELAGLAGDPLRDDFGVFIDQNRHLLILNLFLLGGGDDGGRGFSHGVRADDGQAGFGQHLLAQLFVGALHANDQRHVQVDGLARGDHAFGDDVAAHDAAEDVDQDGLDALVGQHD